MSLSQLVQHVAETEGAESVRGAIALVFLDRPLDNLISEVWFSALGIGQANGNGGAP